LLLLTINKQFNFIDDFFAAVRSINLEAEVRKGCKRSASASRLIIAQWRLNEAALHAKTKA
jgi:hypothetical protein